MPSPLVALSRLSPAQKALPAPVFSSDVEYLAPRNELEQTIADVFGEVLGLERVGIDDSFFALGGDSIVSIQVVSRAKARGVLIIVPSEGETADWPRAVGPLRRGLPEHGWHTLSLTPTDSTSSPGPRSPATEAPTAEEKSDTEKGADLFVTGVDCVEVRLR